MLAYPNNLVVERWKGQDIEKMDLFLIHRGGFCAFAKAHLVLLL
jgi:hypothetical protein